MNKTLIPWVKNPDGSQGYTWNPIIGCLNCTPEGLCLGGLFPCYAYKLANGRLRSRYLANTNLAPTIGDGPTPYLTSTLIDSLDPFYPRFWEDRLGDIPLKPPRGIFVCDMSDLFGVGIPRDWTERVLNIIKGNPQHRFYLLTKQPENLIKFSPFPDNCWVGVTATDHKMFVEACLLLGDIQASVKYLSIEPFLSWGAYPADKTTIKQWAKGLTLYGIKWVIIGAQTKPKKLPKWEWVREIINAANRAGVPVFLKNNLGLPKLNSEGAMPFYKKDPTGTMVLRQEMPTTNV